jgi:hypothetical protein
MKNDVSLEEDCSKSRDSMMKRSICDFEARRIRRTLKCDYREDARVDCRTIAFKVSDTVHEPLIRGFHNRHVPKVPIG